MQPKTSELYSSGKLTTNAKGALPERFENPGAIFCSTRACTNAHCLPADVFKGYGQKQQHPLYQTTSGDIGCVIVLGIILSSI